MNNTQKYNTKKYIENPALLNSSYSSFFQFPQCCIEQFPFMLFRLSNLSFSLLPRALFLNILSFSLTDGRTNGQTDRDRQTLLTLIPRGAMQLRGQFPFTTLEVCGFNTDVFILFHQNDSVEIANDSVEEDPE